MTMRLIDPPSPFASLEEWQEFLQEMQALPQDGEIRQYVELAEKEIKRHKENQR